MAWAGNEAARNYWGLPGHQQHEIKHKFVGRVGNNCAVGGPTLSQFFIYLQLQPLGFL